MALDRELFEARPFTRLNALKHLRSTHQIDEAFYWTEPGARGTGEVALIFHATPLSGAFLIELDPHADDRGFFARSFCMDEFEQHGLNPRVAQQNIALNARSGTVRGMHFQIPGGKETKVVRCTRGAVYDVIVDLRGDSRGALPTFGVELSEDEPTFALRAGGLRPRLPVAHGRQRGHVPDGRRLPARDPARGPVRRPCPRHPMASTRDGDQRKGPALAAAHGSTRYREDVMRKRVMVTGGAGFIGSHLCERLLERGHDVLCVDNLYTGSKDNIEHLIGDPHFEFMRHDVTFPLYVEVDEIYNLACPASPIHYQRDPVQTIKTSVHGAINMLGLAKRTRAKILQASTSEVYGDPQVHPQSEGYWGHVNPIGPRSCYDEGKRAAETLFFDYHRQKRVKIKVARIFNTYGPRMAPHDGRVVSNFIVQALKGEPITIYGDGNQTRSFCYVDDLVSALLKLMDSPDEVTGPVNLGNPGEFTIRELARTRRRDGRGRQPDGAAPPAGGRPTATPTRYHPGQVDAGLGTDHSLGGRARAHHRLLQEGAARRGA